MFNVGAMPVRPVGAPLQFYENYTTTNLYVERPFGINVDTITLANDSTTDTIYLSFDGATLKGELQPGESMTLLTNSRTSIYIRGVAGGGAVRIWGW